MPPREKVAIAVRTITVRPQRASGFAGPVYDPSYAERQAAGSHKAKELPAYDEIVEMKRKFAIEVERFRRSMNS